MYNARLQGERIRSNKNLFIFSSSSKYFFALETILANKKDF